LGLPLSIGVPSGGPRATAIRAASETMAIVAAAKTAKAAAEQARA
jgi:hypothetical protein